jgi:chromate transport protein ChrA
MMEATQNNSPYQEGTPCMRLCLILGSFIIPIVGWIAVYKLWNKYPYMAKMCLACSVVNIVIVAVYVWMLIRQFA